MTLPRHQRPTQLKQFLFGAPYYPEHWSAEDRKHDAARMKAAGVNVVRMGEFAWDLMEPRRNAFDFSLFQEVSDEMGAQGIKSFMCTPTATPPRWLTYGNEHWYRVDVAGKPMQHGNRQHVCTNNHDFRAESRRITRAMAEAFKDNPHVIGWQTDNELYCHISECFCDTCQQEFRKWLEKKYHTIQALNQAWGVAFWAQTYDHFEQIDLARVPQRPAYVNPSQELDWRRFLSDSLCEFQQEQVDILREVQPAWWITHNGTFANYDYWKLAESLDFFSVDVYQAFAGDKPDTFFWGAWKNESARYVSGGYIIPEQNGGAGGQRDYMLPTPENGLMRLWAYQGIARGADGILHFRWRTCRYGAEIFWNGILDHDNKPRRRYDEFCQEGKEFAALSERIIGSVLEVKIGIVTNFEHDQVYVSMPNGFPSPSKQNEALFSAMLMQNLPVGLLDSRDSFDGMEILFLTNHIIEDVALAQKLEKFVAEGGLLIVTARSFSRDANNHVLAQTAPGILTPLIGATREEEGRIVHEDEFKITLPGGAIAAKGGYEILATQSADVLATWRIREGKGYLHPAHGSPAITVNSFGKGHAVYVGSYPHADNIPALLAEAFKFKAVAKQVEAPTYVESSIRHRKGERTLYLLNHSYEPQTVTLPESGKELLSGRQLSGQLTLDPLGVAVIALKDAHQHQPGTRAPSP